MSGWRERIKPASFRGVTFHVESAELSGGRRGVTHEYPLKDEPFREDLGLKARSFPVEGYVLGAEYLAARDALLAKLEESGPGELVHPYYGTRRVAVESFRVRESTSDGGMARFSIDFVETPARPTLPTAVPDAAGKLATSAAAAQDSVGLEFLARYSPGPLLDSVASALESATLAMDNAVNTVGMATQELAAMKRSISEFEDSIASLVGLPEDMLAGLIDLFDGFGAGAESALLTLYDFDPGVRPPATTPTREEEQTNFDATQRLIQRLVVIRAATLAVDQAFDSYGGAVAAREAITDLLDEQSEVAADDTFPALLQLRSDLTKAVPGDAGDLPRLVSHTPAFTVPSLVLAYRLYGHLALEEDLVLRNSVRNPGFVPGAVALEVLSDG